jgi:hypothetical protein
MRGRSTQVLAAALAAAVLAPAAGAVPEFGDAPDGRMTGYHQGARVGGFPSMNANGGAHAIETRTAHLGASVDAEEDSHQVNRDAYDDGVTVTLSPFGASTAVFDVERDAGAAGPAYLNLFFDWNRNGRWGDAHEWVVQNQPIALALHPLRSRHTAFFRAHSLRDGVWYRAILTVNEQWRTASAAGSFAAGEVEDYFQPATARKVARGSASGGTPAAPRTASAP